MSCYTFNGRTPVVDPSAFIHPSANLIGNVKIESDCYIGPGASLRGDLGELIVRRGASVQDNSVMHVGHGDRCIVDAFATIGHGAVLHGCEVGEGALIGINSVVLDGAHIGPDSLVAAMSLVRQGFRCEKRSLLMGAPARFVRPLSADEITWRGVPGESEYERLTRLYKTTLLSSDVPAC